MLYRKKYVYPDEGNKKKKQGLREIKIKSKCYQGIINL